MTLSEIKPNRYLAQKILIGVIGLLLSIVFHEMFHVLMHWGEITSIGAFTTDNALVEIVVAAHQGDDIDGEEMVAYLITLIVMVLTVMLIYRINDEGDTRSTRQILFPGRNGDSQMKSREFWKLAGKADLLPQSPKKNTKTTKK